VYYEFVPIDGGAKEELYTYIECFFSKSQPGRL
jgi:hypothetical protein